MQLEQKRSIRGSVVCFLTALIWGTSFVSQSKGMEFMGPFTFNGVRTLIGASVLLPVMLILRSLSKRKGTAVTFTKKRWLLGGVCCGCALCAASMSQQFGIKYTTVGKTGFVTALYIILVPILGIFIGKKVPKIVWAGAIFAVGGLYLICVQGETGINIGDVFNFISAFLFATHILTVDHFVKGLDSIMLSWLQFVVSGTICLIFAFVFEHPTPEAILAGLTSLLYSGVMSTGVAYTLQVVGQRDANATAAAMVFSLEAPICAISGFVAYKVGLLPNETALNLTQLIGCAIVFISVIVVQIPFPEKKAKAKEKARAEA